MPLLSKYITASFIVFLFSGFSAHAEISTLQCVALGDESTEIKQNNLELLLVGDCKHVRVSGNANKITTENVTSFTVLGNSNKIKVSGAEFVTAGGNKNTIEAKAISFLVLSGNGNSIDGLVIENILMGGVHNTVSYGGSEPKHKIRGRNNKVVSRKKLSLASVTKKPTPSNKAAVTTAQKKNNKQRFAPLPGPQVNVTGKFLNSLPAGYRMDAYTINYWTNSDNTATRHTKLALTSDGQFEVSKFSIGGGGAGSIVVATTNDKKGSTGSVGGAGGVSLRTRKGIDPSKYGTYYISGKQIEMHYANGKVVSHSFKTDGYKELIVGGKRYFVDTPTGWERRNNKANSVYRSLDGRYRAVSVRLDDSHKDGRKWMDNWFKNIKTNNRFVSAEPIKWYKGGYSHYKVGRASMVLVDDNGQKFKSDHFLKYGGSEREFVGVTSYSGDLDLGRILEFLKEL